MKILIEIPEKTYQMIMNDDYDYGDMNIIIQNGTPIKDAGLCDLCKFQEMGCISICYYCNAKLKEV